jgi:hypothetical protein
VRRTEAKSFVKNCTFAPRFSFISMKTSEIWISQQTMAQRQVRQSQPEDRMQAIQAAWPFREEFSLYYYVERIMSNENKH